MFARFDSKKVLNVLKSFTKRRMATAVTQGLKGRVALISGDFQQFSKADKLLIDEAIKTEDQVLVLVNDRNTIPTPANERAHWIRSEVDTRKVQVMVVYGAPELNNPRAMASYSSLIKKTLPKEIQISKLFSKHPFSAFLAQELKVSHHEHQESAGTDEILRGENKNKFSQSIDFQPKSSPNTIRKIIESLNSAEHPNRTSFFKRVKWDLKHLNQVHRPVIVGGLPNLEDQLRFSATYHSQVYDMPIHAPGIGWKIPAELAPHISILEQVEAAERAANPYIDQCFAYVTFDSGIVAPKHYARRSGLHVDGFLTKSNRIPEIDGIVYGDNTYIMCDDLGTEFYSGPFNLSQVDTDDANAVLKAFDKQGMSMSYTQAIPYKIYRMTVNDVHAVHPNDTGEYRQRNFIKVTFSIRPFNRLGSTINPLLDTLNWQYVPRDANGRNTQNYTGSCPVGYLDTNLALINFANQVGPSWCSSFFKVRKQPQLKIRAVPVEQGKYLQTIVGNDLVTTNFSGRNDMEVIRTESDRYFLPREKFNQLYQETTEDEYYSPRPRVLSGVKISEPISVIGIWGTRQNLPKDSIIVSDGSETWGVHPDSFKATYTL